MASDERWRVERVAETGSTNADVAARFRAGEPAGLVLVADQQTAGRGRLGREWVTSPGSSLIVSFLLVPDVRPDRWPWLPLLTGLATAEAVRRTAGVEVGLKWPNDVLVGEQKLAGILLERVADAAVIGVGVNLAQTRDELPVPAATSLAIAGSAVERDVLLAALCEELARAVDDWSSTPGGAELRKAYLARCVTVGQRVRVLVPGGEVAGEAVDVDAGGRLVVRTTRGEEHLAAGDVVHVRPQEDADQ